ncbi:MAG TPA: sulfurtransferase [Solirubrobacteraceae bacterium]|nr:sulfurtransferase [Solirubrobacteraceae bacterium]
MLQAQLGDPQLRVFDCTVVIELGPDGVSLRSGRDAWEREHIPGAGFLDLIDELAAAHPALHFMLPPPEQFAEVMAAHGLGDDARVVLYDSQNGAWAARVWWMLHAYGFDAATVLDGGWTKWTAEGRPTSAAAPAHPRAAFAPRPRPGVFVGKDAVLEAMDDDRACVLNALPEPLHRGEGPPIPGRRQGHIPGSANVPAESLVDPQTRAFLPEAQLRVALEAAGALGAGRVITYCGGGIAASSVAFALRLLGHKGVSVYDASLEEWASDPSLPIEAG